MHLNRLVSIWEPDNATLTSVDVWVAHDRFPDLVAASVLHGVATQKGLELASLVG